ncbi:hypothetical protein PISMIDRAFT_282879 [Pisolithus microcarpus 441]|uniref:Uncharacterized protein n=1 Tax=Pisolithus microcarpus 441 TaxID=765257 RepID=A0A0C9YGX9_9AGAM|nr:hypothetical protein PISMIDRAFT_282879 [Pisolithus microcarpus 441]
MQGVSWPKTSGPIFHRSTVHQLPIHQPDCFQSTTLASANRAVVSAYLRYVTLSHRQSEDDPSMRVLRAARRIEYARKSHSQKYPSLPFHRCSPGGLFMELERQCIPHYGHLSLTLTPV